MQTQQHVNTITIDNEDPTGLHTGIPMAWKSGRPRLLDLVAQALLWRIRLEPVDDATVVGKDGWGQRLSLSN